MIPTPRSTCGRALLVTAALLALALPAASATLVITGTPGTQVTLDGHVVGNKHDDVGLIGLERRDQLANDNQRQQDGVPEHGRFLNRATMETGVGRADCMLRSD